MTSATADWEQLGTSFYRKIQLYTAAFDDDLELDNYVVAGAQCGGALGMIYFGLSLFSSLTSLTAFYRDEGKVQTYRGSLAAKSTIDLYSCAGKLIRSINVGRQVALGKSYSLTKHT